MKYAYTYLNGITGPYRLQWYNNNGYCGEVSIIISGLLFGQYFSQFDTRTIAAHYSSNNPQHVELQMGDNSDIYTATQMRLKYLEWDNTVRNTKSFLQWVKQQTILGFPVSIGVFMNQYLFGNLPYTGAPEYEHIVTVVSVTSNYDDNLYHDEDLLVFTDHGLWGAYPPYPYLFNFTFKSFQGTRAYANLPTSPVYTLCNNANYGD
jgi:hypothetical protein